MRGNPLQPDPLTEKKRELKKLIHSITQLPDSNSTGTIKQLVMYLTQLLRVKAVVPPTSEIMILLQSQKPQLYHGARLSVQSSSLLHMLFSIHGDAQLAATRLEEFMNQ